MLYQLYTNVLAWSLEPHEAGYISQKFKNSQCTKKEKTKVIILSLYHQKDKRVHHILSLSV